MRALVIPMLLVPAPAFAGPVTIKPLVDARLRYENVQQAGFAREADAVTARVRAGFEAKSGAFALLAESEATLALSERYNSGVNGKAGFPAVADPENVELNRLQLQYRGIAKTVVTVGRQRINLDDQRFVGAVGWRDNEQTFDAARIEWSGLKDVKADLTYSWSNRTIWGVNGFGARQQAVSGDNVFANLTVKRPFGTLTAFAYLVDQDEAAISSFRMSSQTYGARYSGAHKLSKAARLLLTASYARQRDFHRNPARYGADYWLGEAGLVARGLKLMGGYEVLGADKGVALTSFQTPLATLHKFNGWADKFLATPPNGLRDAYAAIGYTRPHLGPFENLGLTAAYHDYRSDRLGQHYGGEVNLQLSARIKRYALTLKYADYDARAFATDTRKVWASVEWSL